MTELRKSHMQRVVDEYAELSKSTQKNIMGLFHQIYKFALENDICEKDYSQFVTVTSEKEKENKVPFSREEVKLLWDNLDTYDYADSILIMIYTGVRIGELRHLRKENVHLEERYIELHGTKTEAADQISPYSQENRSTHRKKARGGR